MDFIRITALTDIGNNIAYSSLIPVVDMAGTPTTKKANLQIVANLVLSGAGGSYFAPAARAILAQSVTNAAQPNITSVGTLTSLAVSGNVNLGAVSNVRITGGTNGQVLTTNGNGALSWTTVSSGSNYSNSNVANYLPTFTGTVGANRIASNAASGSNVEISANGAVFAFGQGGALYWPAPGGEQWVIEPNIDNEFEIKSTSNVVISTDINNANAHFTFATDGAVYCPANANFEGTRLNVGPGAGNVPLATNPTLVVTDTGLEFIQAALINQSSNGSSDYAAYGADSDETQGFADLGFTGHTFNDPNYTITEPGDGYVLAQGYANGIGGGLVFATGENGNVPDIIFATGGFLANAEFARIDHSANVFHLTRAGSGIRFADGTTQTTAATGNGTYGNSNVATFLAAFGSNTITTTGNVSVGNIIGNSTIDVDNRASGNTADIRLFSADDIVLQARDRTLGSTTEGGDVNIYAGDSAEDSDSSGGDVQIFAGDGGAGNIDFGGSGGFITIQSGRGGAAIGNSGATAQSGGAITLSAGDAGDNNGNLDLGAAGGAVFIESGFSTGGGDYGGEIVLTTGQGGQNAASGNVRIVIPGYGNTSGGTWKFDATGKLTLPNNSNIATIGNITQFNTCANGFLGLNSYDAGGNNVARVNVNSIDKIVSIGLSDPITEIDYNWAFDDTGNLTLPGNTFAVNYANGTPVSIGGGGANTGNVTFSNNIVIGTGDEFGSAGLFLAPGNGSIANSAVQYLRVRGGDAPTHIHLDTGNNQAYDQYFGDDAKYVKLELGDAGNVVVGTDDATGNSYRWTFTSDGNFILANGNSVIQSIANSSLDPLNPNVSTMVLTPDPGYSTQSLVLDPTFPGHIHLRAPGANIDEPNANIFLGGEESSFEVGYHNGAAPNLFIHSGGNTWTFDNAGNLAFPRDAAGNSDPYLNIFGGSTPTIQSTDVSLAGPANLAIQADYLNYSGFNGNRIVLHADTGEVATDANMVLTTNLANTGNTYSWTFGDDGRLTFPGTPRIDTDANNFEVQAAEAINFEANTVVNIYTDSGNNAYQWQFGDDGTLTVPFEGVIQSFDDTIVLQSVDTGTGNSSSVRLATDGSLYFGGTEYLNGWFQIANDSGDANIVSPSGNISITPAFGVANAAGKSLTLQGGDADQSDFYTGTGGAVNITGGLGSSDDGGGGGPGGDVNIASGLSADPAGHAGNINITAGSNDWIFDYNGDLTLPGNLVYIGASPAPSIRGFSSVSALQFTNGNSNVTVNANSNLWNFDSTGNLTIPGTSGGFIKTASNASIGIAAVDNGTNNPAQLLSLNAGTGAATSIVSAYATNATIQTNAAGTINTWTFGNTGNLTLPANTFAINYANGTQVSLGGSNIANGNSSVSIATAAGNVVANVNGSTVFTAYSGGIKVGGSGILQSPGGAGSITLNNNGANIPTANITTQLNVTGASGANITANLTAGNISTGGTLTSTGKFGYASGSTVTQTTSRGNGVTINTLAGTIITTSAAMAVNEIDTFSVINSSVDPNSDIVLAQIVSPNQGTYNCIANPALIGGFSNGFYINIVNISGFTTSDETITVRFMVIKAPNA